MGRLEKRGSAQPTQSLILYTARLQNRNVIIIIFHSINISPNQSPSKFFSFNIIFLSVHVNHLFAACSVHNLFEAVNIFGVYLEPQWHVAVLQGWKKISLGLVNIRRNPIVVNLHNCIKTKNGRYTHAFFFFFFSQHVRVRLGYNMFWTEQDARQCPLKALMWRWFHGGWHRSAGRGQREGYKKKKEKGGSDGGERWWWGGSGGREGRKEREQAKERGL